LSWLEVYPRDIQMSNSDYLRLGPQVSYALELAKAEQATPSPRPRVVLASVGNQERNRFVEGL
jgi:hypothetical protein